MNHCAFRVLFLFLCVLALSVSIHAQQNQSQPTEKTTSGSIGFFAGKTSLPLYPRGEGHSQKWRGEVELEGRSTNRRFIWGLSADISGGAIVDNPDACAFRFFFKTRVMNNFFIGITHRDEYALNHLIIPDLSARRRESSVNSWWLEFSYHKKTPTYDIRTGYSYMFAGNEPLFVTHFTHPYAKHSLFGRYERHLPRGFTISIDTRVTTANDAKKFRLDIIGAIEKRIPSLPQWSLELRGFTSHNFGSGSLTKYNGTPLENPRGALVGVRYRF